MSDWDWVVELPPQAQRTCARIPNETEARIDAGRLLHALREHARLSETELAAAWNGWLGVELITDRVIQGWEEPGGATPPLHWALTLWEAVLQEPLEASLRRLLAAP